MVVSYRKHQPVLATVPEIEYLAANKLGLPADYKNRYDAAFVWFSFMFFFMGIYV